jgi:antitoxin VapB
MEINMDTAKIFLNGRSQAVRLPKKYRFNSDKVLIFRRGDEVVLKEKKESWGEFFAEESAFGKDYLAKREDIPPQTREFE